MASGFSSGFPSVTRGGGVGGGSQPAGTSGAAATKVARGYKDAMGLPNFADIFAKLNAGGGLDGGTVGGLYTDKEYGNAGAAKDAAGKAYGEMQDWKGQLAAGKAELGKVRHNIENPTDTEGFKNVMRIGDEKLNQATRASAQQANEAASRRGYVGGYNPAGVDQGRLEALAMAGWEGADLERATQMQQFQNESNVYGTDVGGYKGALDAYSNLTSAYAAIPTKSQSSNLQGNPMLDLYSKLLGGLSGGFGDIFGTSLASVEFDANRPSSLQRERFALEQQEKEAEEQRRRAAYTWDQNTPAGKLAAQQAKGQAGAADLNRAKDSSRYDKYGRPYGPAHPYGS